MFFSANAGKRSLALDSEDRRRGSRRCCGSPTAPTWPCRACGPGTAERLGLGPEALRERNPRLVYATIGAFGRSGPLAAEPGYDPLMQAAAGS